MRISFVIAVRTVMSLLRIGVVINVVETTQSVA